MSYCVNCGVELDKSAKKCALCSTAVINPNEKENESGKEPLPPFSSEAYVPDELSPKMKKRIAVATVSTVMFIPNIVCLMLNIFVFKGSFWAIGVVSTSLFLWSAFVLPFLTKKPRPYIMWAADSIMAYFNALVYVWLFGGEAYLFTHLLLPAIAVNSFLILLYMLWYKKERHIILKLAFVFLGLAVSGLVCGYLVSYSGLSQLGTVIGIICLISFLAIFGFFIYCYSSKSLRRWISKRLFV